MNLGPANLAASAPGAQRTGAEADQVKGQQAAQKLAADIERYANRGLGDDLETSTSHGQVGDRDADGRLLHGGTGHPQPDEGTVEQEPEATRPADPLGELGTVIDLDA
jgi:hypothetical protein